MVDIFEENEAEVIEKKIKNQSVYPNNCIVELNYENGSIEMKVIKLPAVWSQLGEFVGFRENIKNGENIPIFKVLEDR